MEEISCLVINNNLNLVEIMKILAYYMAYSLEIDQGLKFKTPIFSHRSFIYIMVHIKESVCGSQARHHLCVYRDIQDENWNSIL